MMGMMGMMGKLKAWCEKIFAFVVQAPPPHKHHGPPAAGSSERRRRAVLFRLHARVVAILGLDRLFVSGPAVKAAGKLHVSSLMMQRRGRQNDCLEVILCDVLQELYVL